MARSPAREEPRDPPRLKTARRLHAGVALAAVVALGLLSRRLHAGVVLWDKSLGDVLYAAMVYLVLAVARPTLSPRALAAGAFGVSFAIELFQLSGVPARLPRLMRLVLGTTFAWHDVACYVAGAALTALADGWARSRRTAAAPPAPGRSSQ